MLFGRPYPCDATAYMVDFSQFKPRGHYTLTPELQRYFRAMIWLGRTEFALTRHARDFLAARLVLDSVAGAGKTMGTWSSIDRTIQIFVGDSDNLTMAGFVRFVNDQGDTATVAGTLADIADVHTDPNTEQVL